MSPHIRLNATKHAIRLILTEENFARQLLNELQPRVLDSDDKVRQSLVAAVCAGAERNIDAFAPLLPLVAGRMADKRVGVRQTARGGLCALYCACVTAQLAENTTCILPSNVHCIPQQLLHCYGTDAGHDVRANRTPLPWSVGRRMRMRAPDARQLAVEDAAILPCAVLL